MRVLLGLLALCLAGCPSLESTRALGTLQAEFVDLVRTEDECSGGGAVEQVCIADFKSMHGLIEAQTVDAINKLKNSKELGDQQITIALYRLAAYASLKADTNNAADYGEGGSNICKVLSSSNTAPPRDCALLEVVGQYEVAEQFADEVNCLRADGCEPDSDPDTLASGFCAKYENLVGKTRKAKNQPFLPDIVKSYLDNQVDNFETSMQSLASYLTRGVDFGNFPEQEKLCGCADLEEEDLNTTNDCGTLPAASRKAILKAECIRVSLGGSPPTCPR